MQSYHPYDAPLDVVSRISSVERGWSTLSAEVVAVAGGTTAVQVLPRPNITMLVGVPVHTTVACDGIVRHRFQVPGQFDVLPRGAAVSWTDRGGSTFLTVDLESHELTAIEPLLGIRDSRIEHLLWALREELQDAQSAGRLFAESIGDALSAHLVRKKRRRLTLPRGPEPRIRRVLDYVGDRLDTDLSLLELAKIADLSVSHFKSVFRASVGVPVHQFVLRERVKLASRLLVETALPISDIALRAGFAHQSHMAASLRRHLGVTPKELRND